MKRLFILLCLLAALCFALLPLCAQSVALDVYNGDTFEEVQVNTGANSLLGFDVNGDPARITAGTGITISGNVITSSGSGSSTLAALTDVTLTSPANNQLLRYNSASSKWVNWTPDFLVSSDLSGYLTSAAAASAYASLTGSYSNPSWITGLAWSKVSGTPTTLAGYGITDAQGLDIELTALAGLTSAADRLPYFTGSGTASLATITSTARNLLDDGSTATMRGTLGIGSMGTQNSNNIAVTGGTMSGVDLGVANATAIILSQTLSLANGGSGTTTEIYGDGLADIVFTTPTSGSVLLSDDSALNGSNISSGTVADARLSANVSLLGSTIALASEVSGTLPIANGGTGESTAANARIALLPSMTGNVGKFLRVNAGATDYELATIGGGGDALTTSTLDQFADVTQTAGKTLAITDNTTLNGGTHSGTNTGDQTTITGNAGTATALQTGRAINGVTFDGTSAITVTAAAGTLTGATLASGVTASSLTSAAGGNFGTAAFTASTAYEVPLTFGTGLTRSTNTITVNASQSLSTLSNLTSNGFVKTSGGTGALSIDTSTYLTTTGNGSSLTGLTQSQISGLTTTDRAQFANVRPTHSTLTYAATTDIDMDTNGFQTVTLTGNITFTTSNRAAGRSKTIRIVGDSSTRTFTFPGGWTWIGAAAPADIAASKDAILTITAFGSADSDIVAAYAVEP